MTQDSPATMASEGWAGEQGEKWNRYAREFESMIALPGLAALEFAGFKPGEHVIDVGCGAGITSLQIAEQVGPDGHVTGLDVSDTLIETCRRRTREAGLKNVDFIAGNAATAQLSGYDHLFSRFGVMFFEDPYLAFRNMSAFLKPEGRMSFICWGPPPENPWVSEMMSVVAQHVQLPPPEPRAPGPFAFADQEYLRDILEQSDFREVDIQSWSGNQFIGGVGADAESAARFIMDATFAGDAVANENEDLKAQVHAGMVAKLRDFETPEGVAMKGTTWLVRAVR